MNDVGVISNCSGVANFGGGGGEEEAADRRPPLRRRS